MATGIIKRSTKTYVSLSDDDCLRALFRAYVDEGYMGQTARHYYYKALGYAVIQLLENHPKSARNAYAYICRLLVKARKHGLIPWSAVIDPGRKRTDYWNWDLQEYADAKTKFSAISLDFWRGQPQRVEIWVEKEAMAALVNSIVRRWRIPVSINRGYGSATVIKDAADRYGNGKGWTLLYIGDFDPSGLDIDRALRDGLKAYGARPNIVRVALSQQDTISLIPNAGVGLKKTDSRYKQFVRLYGERQQGYEIDSLPAHLLRQKLLEYIALYMDLDAFDKVVEMEKGINSVFSKRLEGTLTSLVGQIFNEGVPDSSLPLDEQLRYLRPAPDPTSPIESHTPAEIAEEDEDFNEEDEEESEF